MIPISENDSSLISTPIKNLELKIDNIIDLSRFSYTNFINPTISIYNERN